LSDAHAHYLLTVLRMETGAKLLAFNGKDGEWRVEVTRQSKRAGSLRVLSQTRPQTPLNDLWFLFAPLKKERMDWMVPEGGGDGRGRHPTGDHRAHAEPKTAADKLEANIIEAAEQCGVLAVPCLKSVQNLADLVATWDQNRVVFWCDEHAEVATPTRILEVSRDKPKAVLVGPEGGFSPAEREQLLAAPFAKPIALGPRILRADTAAVAALTAVQMVAGDWSPEKV
jgi:16S rRNA (uracil1498-N3)-methyltransferase